MFFEYLGFEPCRYQDEYFPDHSCQKIHTSFTIIMKVFALFWWFSGTLRKAEIYSFSADCGITLIM